VVKDCDKDDCNIGENEIALACGIRFSGDDKKVLGASGGGKELF